MSLYRAVHSGDLNQVMRHLYWKTDINQPDIDGNYPLHVAAHDGRVRIARALVEHGADPETRNAAGESALRVALGNGKTQVADMLLSEGTSINPQAMLAELVQAGVSDRDSFQFLLRRGASLSQVDDAGDTLLHLAIARGHLDTLARLITLGADVNQPDRDGQRPLTLALKQAKQSHDDGRNIVELLKRNGASDAALSPETQRKPQ
ncbi:ankyrin repeat domain-containing protein [Thiorhodococcus mannitoliphagus]|uniref:ankyrin repeat domain-containing protein n=1 Tax=Thiorhodococcus mannitoliphagus TaxID=329406 RepID=UPI001F10F8B3|nr:ankyrin repeat domain-containing protein [Thiorhodococcus mannitoliphagus]